MDYEKKNRQPYTPEQLQAQLAQAWKWAEMALDRYPGEIPDRSAARNVGTPGEEDRGIFTTATVRAKGSEIIFDLDATQYGESIDPIDRGTLTR